MKKKINYPKSIVAVSIGIIAVWILILAWAFYKEFDTQIIIMFLIMFVTCGIVPVLNLLNHGHKKYASK